MRPQHALRLGSDCGLGCIGFMTVMLVYEVVSLPAIFLVTAAIEVERLAQNPSGLPASFAPSSLQLALSRPHALPHSVISMAHASGSGGPFW
jgi:predicted metal-binding membrane protein